ncbi:GTPase HflX [Candidatus Bathyarchaeota archaeon]|nr:GTPase HflX [Candidatus Bathyarchaeota archaeon]
MKTVIVECKVPTLVSRVNEVSSMAEALGYDVIDKIIQKRRSINHSYCIGRGKLQELKKVVKERKVEVVVFCNTLSSAQAFKIKKELGQDVEVIDRNLLILELFKSRALSSEAKLQIKLAKLKYTFSWGREYLKLKGILNEQVGWSGPGDYPFNEYEKAAKRRISRIKKKLEEIKLKKDALRKRRHELGYPIVALAGYTQSGKTTFFNKLTFENKNVGLGPFTTLSTFARKINDLNFILIDSIGFIDDMHPIILDAFNATLNEIANADLILLFIDASDDFEILIRKMNTSDQILRRIGASSKMIICINKIDLVNKEKLEEIHKIVKRKFLGVKTVFISAKTGENLDELLKLIVENLKEEFKTLVYAR